MSDLNNDNFNYSDLSTLFNLIKFLTFMELEKLYKNKKFFTKNSLIFKTVEEF